MLETPFEWVSVIALLIGFWISAPTQRKKPHQSEGGNVRFDN